MKHYINAFVNYANFSGRATISQYWTFYLLSVLFGTLSWFIPPIAIVYILFQIIPSTSILVRRLHDTGHSGAYIFIGVIPIIGWIWLLILLLKEGDVGENNYGMPSSSSNSNTNTKHEEEFGSNYKSKTYTNTNNVGLIDDHVSSNDISQLSPIEKIERQYEKGIFTEKEKEDLISNVLNEKQNEEIEKIKENYNNVLDTYRDVFLEMYTVECIEIEDLYKQEIIDEKTFKSKLNLLKTNIAKRIQKEIKFKTIKGFEIFIGLEVKNENLHGVIVEIINSKKVCVQLNFDQKFSKPWSIDHITPNGKVKTDVGDWELDENNFLLQSDFDYYGLVNLKLGDSYKEGVVFFVSKEEVKTYRNSFIKSDFKTLKTKEDNIWKIPDVESVKKCVKHLNNQGEFVPKIPEYIWTSEKLDSSSTKCVQVAYNDNHTPPTTIIVSDNRHQYGILVQTIKI